MKKFFVGVLFYLMTAIQSFAGVPCSLPFTLTNGTLADATQVMANYNAITTCLLSAAASGANADITSLLSLSTPIGPTVGGTNVYIGGTSTGSANAQVVGSTVPNTFTLTAGYRVVFLAGFTNTAAATLNVNGTGATAIGRRVATGTIALAGGEISNTTITEAIYDGTQFVIQNPVSSQLPVGTVLDYAGLSAPTGFLLAGGGCISQTTFAGLFAILGTTYNVACGGGTFGIPDLRGKAVFGTDNMGTLGTAGLITSAGSGITGTTVGATGGAQNILTTRANLLNAVVTVNVADHNHTAGVNNSANSSTNPNGIYPGTSAGGNIYANTKNSTFAGDFIALATGLTGTFNLNGGVTQTPVVLMNPAMIMNKIIKY